MDFSVAQFEKAVHQFYYDSANQAEAHRWLTTAQISPEAWKFCWDLMQLDKSPEVQFFGASSLHIKIARFWSELLVSQHEELKNKLIEHILKYADGGPRIVLTRLCIALSCYIIRTVHEEWPSAVQDLVSTFQPSSVSHLPVSQALGILLEILTVLPEEFQSILLAQSHRRILRNCLQGNINLVLPLVEQILTQSNDSSLRLQALRCFSSWVQFGIPLQENTSVLMAVLNCASEPDLCESVVESLTNFVTHPDIHKYHSSLIGLIGELLKLESILQKALQDKDMELCSSVYNLFVLIGETHTRLLLEALKEEKTRDQVLKIVQIILQCSGAPGQYPVEELCSSLPFGFWYSLQDEIMSADPPNSKLFLPFFIPVFETLVDILLVKVMYPSSHELNMWNSDEKEQLRCYRQDIGDTLMYCYNLLRERMLERLNHHINTVILSASNNADPCQALEACLFAFQSISENVDLEENNYVPRFLSLLPTLPFNRNSQAISTALDTVGAYAEWINAHPEVLIHIIPLLIMGLNIPEVSPSATHALKDISRDCQPSLRPFAEQILTASQEALRNGILKPQEQIRLMSTVGYVLSVLPVQTIMAYLDVLLTPYFQELQHFGQEKEITVTAQSQIVLRLTMLSMLFANLDVRSLDIINSELESQRQMKQAQENREPQPVLLIMQQLLPVIDQFNIVWKTRPIIAEGICDLLKRSVSTLLDDCLPILNNVLDLILYLFEAYPNVAALGLMKQLILLFRKEESLKVHLKKAFQRFVGVSIDLCHKGISENSDVIENFYQVLAQILKKHPEFLQEESFNLSVLFHFGTVALAVPEATTVKAASSFLVNFVTYSRESTLMMTIVNNQGGDLLCQALKCIGGESPRGVMDSMADILLALNKKYFDNMCRWINTLMNQENFPCARPTLEQKQHFVRQVLKERTNKRKLQEIVKEFTLICRGLIGTEYAVHILPCL